MKSSGQSFGAILSFLIWGSTSLEYKREEQPGTDILWRYAIFGYIRHVENPLSFWKSKGGADIVESSRVFRVEQHVVITKSFWYMGGMFEKRGCSQFARWIISPKQDYLLVWKWGRLSEANMVFSDADFGYCKPYIKGTVVFGSRTKESPWSRALAFWIERHGAIVFLFFVKSRRL